MATVRNLVTGGQWARITRDAPKRLWTFEIGVSGRPAHINESRTFRQIGVDWYDADLHARMIIAGLNHA